jgi:hypothetical protein
MTVVNMISNYREYTLGQGTGKVPVLFLTEYHAMKAYWGVEVQLHAFFNLGTRWR